MRTDAILQTDLVHLRNVQCVRLQEEEHEYLIDLPPPTASVQRSQYL